MKFGLKNRLRLISLFPILILFALASYYVYTSYISFQSAQTLQARLEQNKQLNDLINNISRERGMTVMFLGNGSATTLKSLQAQRLIVDEQIKNFSAQQHNPKIAALLKEFEKGRAEARPSVDNRSADFNEVFEDVYGKSQVALIGELSSLAAIDFDSQISILESNYLSLVRANEYTGLERDYLTYLLSRNSALEDEEIDKWISLIAKADAISFEAIADPSLKNSLNAALFTEDNTELFQDITSERSGILRVSDDGDYETQSGIWFAMLSEKINAINEIEQLLISDMDSRADAVKNNAVQFLVIAITVWLVALVMGVLGYLLSNEIAKNIKNLESVLKRVAADFHDDETENLTHTINLDTAEGTAQAYALLERIIEQTLREKQFALEASEAKSMFLANMSHEIRTPLNGIVGFTELLKDTELHDEQREFIDIIEKSSENLLEIINNILDLSKIESNKLEIEDIAFNPIDEFESAVEVYAVRASEKHIDLGCFIDPSLESPLKGDPTKIKEVIINLLSNAVKFTNSGGSVNVDVRRLESTEPGRAVVRFQVKDSGIGVTSEQRSRIFEAFSQADTSITRKYGGTGLGLTISSRFVELMGGQLDLTSEPGNGTTFFFTLTFEEIETLNEPLKGSFSNINALVHESKTKKKVQTTYLKEYLDYMGVSYTTFHNIDELRALERQVNYDLLFVDNDYIAHEDELLGYVAANEQLVLITKSYYMKRIDSLGLDIFKVLYEPLNSSKVRSTLETYDSEALSARKQKTQRRKKFDEKNSKFAANVLVAEDNIINQKLIRRTLEDLGLTITVANNGLEAFEKRKNGEFDLIFMDIQMPVLDGMEATQEILDFEEDYGQTHVPIIALTANALKGDRERFMAVGMDEYTTKPLVRSDIISLLNNFLAHKIIDINVVPKSASDIVEVSAVVAEETVETKATPTIPEAIEVPASEPTVDISISEAIEVPIVKPIIEITTPAITEVAAVSKPAVHADILLAKQNALEGRLFARILEDLGYTYVSVDSASELLTRARSENYKLVLFDKSLPELVISELYDIIRQNNNDVSLVMLIDPNEAEDASDSKYVHEMIKNIINKDLLRLVFEKFI